MTNILYEALSDETKYDKYREIPLEFLPSQIITTNGKSRLVISSFR